VPALRDADEIARQLQEHALLRGCAERVIAAQTLEEMAHIDTERLSDAVKAAGRDPVDAFLVLVSLLVRHADQFGHLLLGETQHHASLADPDPDMPVDILRAGPVGDRFRVRRGHAHCFPIFGPGETGVGAAAYRC
jgi:hypothetical protein